ncbi:MAG: ABC transporter permease [Chloroflexi bacterium]|nr:ABC transporter permease [Chloroflexota bacterium]
MFRSSKKRKHNILSFVWQQMNVQFRMRALSFFSFGLLVVQPAAFSAVGYLLARMAGKSQPDLVYVIIGGGIMGLWSRLLFTSFYDISDDRREGMLELIIGSPTSFTFVLAVKTLTNVLAGSISMILAFLAAKLFFDFSVPLHNIPYILISLLVLMFGFWSIGFFLAHFRVWSRVTGMFINYLELPVSILAAFMFPIEYLPRSILWLSDGIPVRWGVTGLNFSFQTQLEFAAIWPSWAAALAISFVYLLITFFMSKKVHDMIRVSGELSSV